MPNIRTIRTIRIFEITNVTQGSVVLAGVIEPKFDYLPDMGVLKAWGVESVR